MRRRLNIEDLAPLSLGAAVLGTGGGGDPYLGQLAARREFELSGPAELIDVADLDDGALVVPVAMGGAPAIGLEKLLSLPFAETPVRRLEAYLGRKVDAVVPLEIGGVNALLPFMVAARLGVPVVDGDSMGRAFPTLDNTTFNIFGLSASPVVVTNEHADAVIIDVKLNARCEVVSRAVLTELGGATCSTLYPLSGAQAKQTLIPRTVSLALSVGRAIDDARAAGEDPLAALVAALTRFDPTIRSRPLFEGKVVDVRREIVGGFNTGRAILAGVGGWTGEVELLFQNEYLRATLGDRLLAIVPDLICCLDSETADPATCETLRYGQRLKVLGLSCTPVMRTPRGLACCGPAAFGLSDAYGPVEDLVD